MLNILYLWNACEQQHFRNDNFVPILNKVTGVKYPTGHFPFIL